MTDQALFAGTNFLVDILLARSLDPEEHGAFVTAYSTFPLFGTLHTALWTEPVLVIGSRRCRPRFPSYLVILLRSHCIFGRLALLFSAIAGLFFREFGELTLGNALLGLVVTASLTLYLWPVRRSTYVLLEPRFATYGGALYLLFFIGLAANLSGTDFLDAATILIAMGAAEILAGWTTQHIIRMRTSQIDVMENRSTAIHNWRYGRWAATAGALSLYSSEYLLHHSHHHVRS